MKVATYQGERNVKVVDAPKPSISGSRDALVKITLGAVCGSDLHIYHGNIPMTFGEPLGPEFVGAIEEVGCELERFKPRERAPASFTAACGLSTRCRQN